MALKKFAADLKVKENRLLPPNYCLLILTSDEPLPEMLPGQFVQVLVDRSSNTFLRRPLSICWVDREKNELWLLIQFVGDGTKALGKYAAGDTINLLFPLGNTFTMPEQKEARTLLIGGGVGVAPLLFLGSELKKAGCQPEFLLGARSKNDLKLLEAFEQIGKVHITTEDDSMGEKGYVTNHSVLKETSFVQIYTCGPKPMMVSVARYAKENGINCEVSLENMMACGVGACLCCVEKTVAGNICVCTEGPVFNIKELTWQI